MPVLIALLLGLPAWLPRQDGADTGVVAAWAERIRQSMNQPINFESVIDVIYLTPRDPSATPDEWNADSWSMRETIRTVIWGDRFFQHLSRFDGTNSRPYESSLLWDGERSWTHYTGGDDDMLVSSGIGPMDMGGFGLIYHLMEARVPATAPRSQHQMLTLAAMVDISTDGDRTIIRYHDHIPDSRWRYRLELIRHQQGWVLDRYEIVMLAPRASSEGEDTVVVRRGYEVDEWRDVEGFAFPVVAHVDCFDMTPEGSGQASRWLYRTTQWRLLESEPDETLTPALTDGTRVADADLDISFTIGKPYLYMDGTTYVLDQPLHAHPGSDLASLVSSARTTYESVDARPNGSNNQRPWLLLIMGGTVILGVVVVIALRRRRTFLRSALPRNSKP